jgi:hypothetical protein
MFKELEIHEAEPELLAEPLGGTKEAAPVSVAADAQGKKDASTVSTDVEAQAQDQGPNARTGVFTSLRRSFLKRGSERSIPGDDAMPAPAKSESASTPVPRE